MRLGKRLTKVAEALAARGRADQFHVVEAIAVGQERAQGRAAGLYRDGPEGSLAKWQWATATTSGRAAWTWECTVNAAWLTW